MFNPQVNLSSRMQSSTVNSGFSLEKMNSLEGTTSDSSFKNVLSGMVTNVNEQLNTPDKLLSDAVTGTGNVDVHDVMVAMSKAELTLTVATNAISKVIQAYDKINQIQV